MATDCEYDMNRLNHIGDDMVAAFNDGYAQGKADAERKRGKWIYQFHEDEVGITCSECEGYAESFARWIYDEGYRIDYNFCPNCGAQMESGGE